MLMQSNIARCNKALKFLCPLLQLLASGLQQFHTNTGKYIFMLEGVVNSSYVGREVCW